MNNTVELSKKEKLKLAYILFQKETSYERASRTLDISLATYGRWVRSFKRKGYRRTVKEFGCWRSGTPHNKTSEGIVKLVKDLRKQDRYGRWKTMLILKDEYGISLSESTISRIIKTKGLSKQTMKYPSKKGEYEHIVPFFPGDLVQADPLQVGELFVCNFCDWITRMRFSSVMVRQNQGEAKRCITEAIEYFPFPIQRLQWDNGGEAGKETEEFVLQLLGTPLNHTPVHTPKRNGLVERLNRTIRDEEVGYAQFKLKEKDKLEEILNEGIWKYNYYRPHHSLQGKTPMKIWNDYCNTQNLLTYTQIP